MIIPYLNNSVYVWGVVSMSNVGYPFNQSNNSLQLESPKANYSDFASAPKIKPYDMGNMNNDDTLKKSSLPPTSRPHMSQTDLNALPAGKAFKEGSKILLPAKAFDVYHMNALYADTNNISGEVREINGNLYAKGENPIIEYTPKEQIIQPNNHIVGVTKNAEADKRLESIKQKKSDVHNDMSLNSMLPNVLLGSIAGAVSGALLHSPLLMMGSLGIAGVAIHLANDQYQKVAQLESDDFKKKIASFS